MQEHTTERQPTDLRRSTACEVGAPSFNFECPIQFFKKSDEDEGKQRRIAGIISTDTPDQQGESLLQNGLDFSSFVKLGWYNDNHLKGTTDILGYPETVKSFRKGEALPDGTTAKANLTWTEGYLVDTRKANDIWELGCALQKTGRRLGFSVEGSIDKRVGAGGNTIAKARVRNVAITNCPVNADTRLEVLARSLAAIEAADNDARKALGVGNAAQTGASPAPNVPHAGSDAGQILAPESLERDIRNTAGAKKKRIKKGMNDAQATQWVKAHVPGVDHQTAFLFVRLTKAMSRSGLL